MVTAQWATTMRAALDQDKWGQVLEAEKSYAALQSELKSYVKGHTRMPLNTTALFNRVCIAIELRLKSLDDIDDDLISVSDLGKLGPVLEHILDPTQPEFPLDMTRWSSEIETMPSVPSVPAVLEGGSLLPPPPPRTDDGVYMTLQVDTVHVPDPTAYVRPFVCCTVVTASGHLIESPQDTPNCRARKDDGLVFENQVHLQTPVNHIRQGSMVILELKHYKPSKKKVSTRCYAVLELTQVQPGTISLPLYKKPTDFACSRRRKPFGRHRLIVHVRLAVS